MRNDKEAVLKLRLKGKSYSEINKELGVPKSTLSGWFSDVVLSKTAQERIEKRSRKKSAEGLIKIKTVGRLGGSGKKRWVYLRKTLVNTCKHK